MTDLERILPLWREMEATGSDYVLATVVAVEGSSYRRPGACMLMASGGRRAGTVSGGCLEAEIASRAWWLTEKGPSIHRYSTAADDGELPYGSGCGGVVYVLLERRATARPLLAAMEQAFLHRTALAVATVIDGSRIGLRGFAGLARQIPPAGALDAQLQKLAEEALAGGHSAEKPAVVESAAIRVWTNFRPARHGLWIFGAGDDAQPLVHMAKELGWYVTLADGRSHLATNTRFPLADEVHVLPVRKMPAAGTAQRLPALANLRSTDAAVLMSHSFDQDARVLATLLPLDPPLAYIGVLGPRQRAHDLLVEVGCLLNEETAPPAEAQIEQRLARLHAPTGLDLGAEAPETIALSIAAEVQKAFAAATALPLREVRAVQPAAASR